MMEDAAILSDSNFVGSDGALEEEEDEEEDFFEAEVVADEEGAGAAAIGGGSGSAVGYELAGYLGCALGFAG